MSAFLQRITLRRQRRKKYRGDLTESLVTLHAPESATSEAFRGLRTSLLYSFVDNPPQVISLTSPGAGEGKSTVCTNLGLALAQANKKTLLVDCDLRMPAIHRFFELSNARGVVDILLGGDSLQEISVEPAPGLSIVCAGPTPPDPTELLGSRRLSEFFASVREEFDYVLVDSSPIGLVSDPAILATQCDGVLLVLDAQNTSKRSVREAIRSLEAVGADTLGTVMNNTKISKEDAGYYAGYRDGEDKQRWPYF